MTGRNRPGKYDPLRDRLLRAGAEPVEMTFAEIQALVGPLPRAAREHAAWWNNEPAGTRHVQAAAWRDAGRTVVSVSRIEGRVRFSAPSWHRGARH